MSLFPNDPLLNVAATSMQTEATRAQLYTALPNDAGTTNASTAARLTVTWDAAAAGDMVVTTDLAFTGGTASGPCTHVGFWSADDLTYYGHRALTGDQAFAADGTYTITGGTIDGISS